MAKEQLYLNWLNDPVNDPYREDPIFIASNREIFESLLSEQTA